MDEATPRDVGSAEARPRKAQKPLVEVLAMSKGNDSDSYSKLSELQDCLSQLQRQDLTDALQIVALPSKGEGPVVVADLGSSSGPNTITNVAFIVDKLRARMPQGAEFQAYFNDLPSNDFNNLFQLLTHGDRHQKFFAAGVPGTFYDRLFAESSVHIFFSAHCLHWISKIPDEMLDESSPAYNKGRMWLFESPSEVARAYQRQSMLDMKNFLQARAAELVSGGLLFFVCGASLSSEPDEVGMNFLINNFCERDLQEVWSDLIAEGLLTEHQRDTFNIPIYMRRKEDLQEAVASCGSLFDVKIAKVELVETSVKDAFGSTDPTIVAQKWMGAWKAMLNAVLEDHVGKKPAVVIWERLVKVLERRIRGVGLDFKVPFGIFSLIRK